MFLFATTRKVDIYFERVDPISIVIDRVHQMHVVKCSVWVTTSGAVLHDSGELENKK
jgi:hypothetical protein